MKIWKCVLTCSVLTAMVFVPQISYIPEPTQTASQLKGVSLESIPLTMPTRVPADLTARSPISAFTTAQKPLRGFRICIDPGHGGQRYSKTHYTGGTIGVATGQTESEVNLRVSVMLKSYLQAAGAEIIMTRESDDRCTGNNCEKQAELDFRSNLANARGADLFISVHHNDAGRSAANYSAVFYPKGTVQSISLAENIARAMHNYMGVPTVGAKSGAYRVLDKIRMPGVIVEASFMTNAHEDRRLAHPGYNKLEAKGIATGIINYFRLTKGREADLPTIFAPIDENASNAQAIADASFIRRDVIERKSLFGTVVEELNYDGQGRIASRREVSNTRTVAGKTSDKAKKTVITASNKSAKTAKATVVKTASSARKVTASVSKKASTAVKRAKKRT